jgi:hypothetical protein
MEIFGGFMVMMSIISLFLAVVWLIMPFVVFAIKGKQDRTLEVLEGIDKRLAALESRLLPTEPVQTPPVKDSTDTLVLSRADTAAPSTESLAENI